MARPNFIVNITVAHKWITKSIRMSNRASTRRGSWWEGTPCSFAWVDAVNDKAGLQKKTCGDRSVTCRAWKAALDPWEESSFFQALIICRLVQGDEQAGHWCRGMNRLAIARQHGDTYPVVRMCSVVVEFPQWNVLRITWGVHPHGGASRHMVKNEPKSSFL